MELQAWKNKNKKGYMLQINEDEAMNIIKSLISQIISQNANSGRSEFYTNKNEYFSISVLCEKESYFKKCIDQRQKIIDEQNEVIQKLLNKKVE